MSDSIRDLRVAYDRACQAADKAYDRYKALPTDASDDDTDAAFAACEDTGRDLQERWKELTDEYPAAVDDLAAESIRRPSAVDDDTDVLG